MRTRIRFIAKNVYIENIGDGVEIHYKNSIFDSPLILDHTFSQTKFAIGKSDFTHIMPFH